MAFFNQFYDDIEDTMDARSRKKKQSFGFYKAVTEDKCVLRDLNILFYTIGENKYKE